MIPAPPPKVVNRRHDGLIHAYVIDSRARGALEPAAVFRPRAGDEIVASVVRPDLERAVYATLHDVVCVSRAGEVVWASAFEPRSETRYGHEPGVALSRDGRTVWVYRPDAMAGRGGDDQWVVHDADGGSVVARYALRSIGHGATHFVHPRDGSAYLCIGEGQDGAAVARAAIGVDGTVSFERYPWWDRCLIQLSPDGEQFMTVDHGQADVSFHLHPSGDVLITLPVEAFGYDPEDACIEWSGGYLTPDTAVVTLAGETEDGEDWFRCHVVDVRTGNVGGDIATGSAHPYDMQFLGDGSWITDGPVRRFRSGAEHQPAEQQS